MRTVAAFVALAASVALASNVPTYKSSLDMQIDPNSVVDSDRAVWCNSQNDACRSLCDNDLASIGCDPTDLKYQCTCASNNSAPALQYYQQTMPTSICQRLFADCTEKNVGDADALDDCKSHIQSLCGTVPPPKIKADTSDDDSSTTSTSMAPTSSTTTTSSTATSTKSDNFAAPTMAPAAAAAALGLMAYLI